MRNKTKTTMLLIGLGLGLGLVAVAGWAATVATTPDWSLNATIIEACSCPMFCQCYFNTRAGRAPGLLPPGTRSTAAPRYCRFNNAFKVNNGSYGDASSSTARSSGSPATSAATSRRARWTGRCCTSIRR